MYLSQIPISVCFIQHYILYDGNNLSWFRRLDVSGNVGKILWISFLVILSHMETLLLVKMWLHKAASAPCGWNFQTCGNSINDFIAGVLPSTPAAVWHHWLGRVQWLKVWIDDYLLSRRSFITQKRTFYHSPYFLMFYWPHTVCPYWDPNQIMEFIGWIIWK